MMSLTPRSRPAWSRTKTTAKEATKTSLAFKVKALDRLLLVQREVDARVRSPPNVGEWGSSAEGKATSPTHEALPIEKGREQRERRPQANGGESARLAPPSEAEAERSFPVLFSLRAIDGLAEAAKREKERKAAVVASKRTDRPTDRPRS